LRQAYDYWQDQPGNYFPNARVTPMHKRPGTWHPQGTLSQVGSSSYGQLTRSCSTPLVKGGVPHNQIALFPGPTCFRRSSPCQLVTGIVAFRENCQQPARNNKNVIPRTVATDSQMVNCDRFSHRQVIHILLQRKQTSHKEDA